MFFLWANVVHGKRQNLLWTKPVFYVDILDPKVKTRSTDSFNVNMN
jgi:hypothetical protein